MRADLPLRFIPMGLLLGFPALAANYRVVTVSNGGSIEGVVKLTAVTPAVRPTKPTKNQAYCGTSIPNPLYEAGKDLCLKNVEVFIKKIERGKPNPAGTVTLLNNHCMFEPRVQGASVGERLKMASNDPILHTVHPQVGDKNATLYNIALPYKGVSVIKPLPSVPGLIRVKCDAHEWMHAWIWEFDHPYYATTDGEGRFKITDIPPGTYTVVAWHELMGQKEMVVTVGPEKSVTLNFTLTPGK